MKKLKRLVAMTLAAVLSANTVVAQAQWVHHGTEWMYQDQAGKTLYGWQQTEPNNWYYLGSDGIMQTGFVKINNNFYYLNEKDHGVEGLMRTGWYQEPNNKNWYFFDTRPETLGAMYTGHWAWVDGYCYYFDTTGKMAESTSIDGFQVDKDGRWTVDGVVQYQPGKGVSGKLVTTDNSSGSSTGGSSGGSHGSSGGSSGSSNGSHGSTSETKNTDTTVKNDDSTETDTPNNETKADINGGSDKPNESPKSHNNDNNSSSTGDDKPEVTKPSIQDRPSKHDETDDGSDDISRYEWLMYVMDATEKEPSDNENLTNTFDDIDEDTEEGRYVLTAASLGILPDVEDTSVFDGDAPATREFAAVTTVNAMGYVADRELTKEDKRMFTDFSSLEYPVHDVISVKMEYMYANEKDAFAPDENLATEDAQEIIEKIEEKRESWEHIGDNPVYEVEYKDGFLKDELAEETQYRLEVLNDDKYQITIPKNENTKLIKKGSLFMLPYTIPDTESVPLRALDVKEDSLRKYYLITAEIPDAEDVYDRIYVEDCIKNISYNGIKPCKGVTVTYTDEDGTQHVIDGDEETGDNVILDTLTEDDELNILKSNLVDNKRVASSSTLKDEDIYRLLNDEDIDDIATQSILKKATNYDSESILGDVLNEHAIASESEIQYKIFDISGADTDKFQPSMLSASLKSGEFDYKDGLNTIVPDINFSVKIPNLPLTIYATGKLDFKECRFLYDTENNTYQLHSRFKKQDLVTFWFENEDGNLLSKKHSDLISKYTKSLKKELGEDKEGNTIIPLGEIPISTQGVVVYLKINLVLTAVGTIEFGLGYSLEQHMTIENGEMSFDPDFELESPSLKANGSIKLGLDVELGFGLGIWPPLEIFKLDVELLSIHAMPYFKLGIDLSDVFNYVMDDTKWPICIDATFSTAASIWLQLEGPLKYLFEDRMPPKGTFKRSLIDNSKLNWWWEFPLPWGGTLFHMEQANLNDNLSFVEKCTRKEDRKIELCVKRKKGITEPEDVPLDGAKIKVKKGNKLIAIWETDKNGKYEGSFSSGTYTIEISHEGYKTKTIENVVLTQSKGYDETVNVNVKSKVYGYFIASLLRLIQIVTKELFHASLYEQSIIVQVFQLMKT